MNDIPLLFGLVTAILHVLSGPDHLAAVTPLVFDQNKKGWRVGFIWGLGHLVGMLSLGLLFLFFKPYIPVEKISENSEFLVGFVLIFIGAWALFQYFRRAKNTHVQDLKSDNASFGIGVLHGLAGLAHFVLLLPVLGFESTLESSLYIGGFAIGTVLAMTMYTLLLGKLSVFSKTMSHSFWAKGLRIGGSVFAIVVGVFWIFQH